MALIGGQIRSSATHSGLAFANACNTGTLTCSATDGQGIWNGDWGFEGISVTASAGGFYPKTVTFVSPGDVAWYPDYGAYGYWKIIELDPMPAPPPSSCFTADTLVAMGDGSSRLIAEVAPGDLVVAHDGQLVRVRAIETPQLGGRRLYGINGGSPFVTAEHPFLAEDGWKAIDPDATALENAELAVRRIQVGDSLVVAAAVRSLVSIGAPGDSVDIEYARIPVKSLDGVLADPDQTVYNLLLDGQHTYLANGFAVHNKGSH